MRFLDVFNSKTKEHSMMQKVMKVVVAMVTVGFIAHQSDASERVGGAVYEFNASNNAGDVSDVFTNLGTLGGELAPSSYNDIHSGVAYGGKPVLVDDGPGPLLNMSYANVDAAGKPAVWMGNLFPFSAGQISIEMWLKRASDQKPGPEGWGNEQYIFSLNSASRNSEMFWRWDQGSNEDIDINGSVGDLIDIVDFPAALNEWRHVVIAFDDTADTVTTYVDGVKLVDNQAHSWDVGGDWSSVHLGTMGVSSGDTQPPGNRHNGSIALTAVYPFILTDAQVMNNMMAIPEPTSLALLSLGGLAMAMLRRRR